MTRRGTWCADRSLAKCFVLTAVHVTYPYSGVSITSAFSMRTFRRSGASVMSYNSGPNRLKAYPLETDPSFDFEREVSAFVDNAIRR